MNKTCTREKEMEEIRKCMTMESSGIITGQIFDGRLITSEDQRFDIVKRPAHYNQGKIEVWDFIIDQGLNYLEGNVVKYVARHKYKNGLQDLLKAQAYINKLVETERNKESIKQMNSISKGE